ncbi:MAG: glycosyltransferase family 2 protein [Chloroflexi bacterium]|nr:glycosyltransferase family 2 protein [Chloroflexota bacterium]
MDLSVIIVNWNVRDLLAACVDSVLRFTRPSLETEVIVVDNASHDGSPNMIRQRFPSVHLLANTENKGFAGGNNQGLRAATGRYLALLNPDTEVRGDALGTLVDFLAATPNAGMVGPRLIHSDGSFQHSAFRFPTLAMAFFDFFPLHHRLIHSRLNGRYPRRLYDAGVPFPIDHPLGACMVLRREVIEQVGLLDEGFFMYCEEIDWAMRVRKAGWGIYCVPAAEVVHHVGQSTRQSRDEMFVTLWRSRYRLFEKYYGPAYRWLVRRIVRLGMAREVARVRRALRRGEMSRTEAQSRLSACRLVASL